MEVGFPPSMEMNSGVFQRETRKVLCEGLRGSRWEIVRRGVVRWKVGSVIVGGVIGDSG
jgi:hypothetical protein